MYFSMVRRAIPCVRNWLRAPIGYSKLPKIQGWFSLLFILANKSYISASFLSINVVSFVTCMRLVCIFLCGIYLGYFLDYLLSGGQLIVTNVQASCQKANTLWWVLHLGGLDIQTNVYDASYILIIFLMGSYWQLFAKSKNEIQQDTWKEFL